MRLHCDHQSHSSSPNLGRLNSTHSIVKQRLLELEEKKKEMTVRTRELAEAVHENLDEMNAMRPKRKKLNKQVQQIIRLLKEKGVDVDPKKISIPHNNEDEEEVYARLKVRRRLLMYCTPSFFQ